MSPPPASSNSSPEQVRAAVPAAWSLAKLGCGRARIVAPPISVMCRRRPPSDYHAAPRRFWRGRLARTLAEACASLDHRTVTRVIRLWCGRLARTGACGLLPDKAPGSSMDSMDAMDIIPRRRPGGNLPGSAAVPAAWPSSWDRRRPGGLALLAAQFISSLERWITTRKCPRLVLTTDQTGAFVHRWQLAVLSDGSSASSGLFPSCRPLCPHP